MRFLYTKLFHTHLTRRKTERENLAGEQESGERRQTVERAPQEWIMGERSHVRPRRLAARSEVSCEPTEKPVTE